MYTDHTMVCVYFTDLRRVHFAPIRNVYSMIDQFLLVLELYNTWLPIVRLYIMYFVKVHD